MKTTGLDDSFTNKWFGGEVGKVSAWKIRQIDYDHRVTMLSSRDDATKKILAESLLTQVEVGAASIRALNRLAEEQGQTSTEIRSLCASSLAMHQAAQEDARLREIRMDDRFSELLEAERESREALTGALEGVGERISDAIQAACEVLHGDMAHLQALSEESNKSLQRIEKLLTNPNDTSLRELIARAVKLTSQGMVTTGKWQRDNFQDAMGVIREVLLSAFGQSNPLIWFQKGYLIWQCAEGAQADDGVLSQFQEACEAFERSARLYGQEEQEWFKKALRHCAHMHYLLNNFSAAEEMLSMINKNDLDFDTAYDLARYKTKQGKLNEAVSLLFAKCIPESPSVLIRTFSEPDFIPLSELIINGLPKYTENLKQFPRRCVREYVDSTLSLLPDTRTYDCNWARFDHNFKPTYLGTSAQQLEIYKILSEIESSENPVEVQTKSDTFKKKWNNGILRTKSNNWGLVYAIALAPNLGPVAALPLIKGALNVSIAAFEKLPSSFPDLWSLEELQRLIDDPIFSSVRDQISQMIYAESKGSLWKSVWIEMSQFYGVFSQIRNRCKFYNLELKLSPLSVKMINIITSPKGVEGINFSELKTLETDLKVWQAELLGPVALVFPLRKSILSKLDQNHPLVNLTGLPAAVSSSIIFEIMLILGRYGQIQEACKDDNGNDCSDLAKFSDFISLMEHIGVYNQILLPHHKRYYKFSEEVKSGDDMKWKFEYSYYEYDDSFHRSCSLTLKSRETGGFIFSKKRFQLAKEPILFRDIKENVTNNGAVWRELLNRLPDENPVQYLFTDELKSNI